MRGRDVPAPTRPAYAVLEELFTSELGFSCEVKTDGQYTRLRGLTPDLSAALKVDDLGGRVVRIEVIVDPNIASQDEMLRMWGELISVIAADDLEAVAQWAAVGRQALTADWEPITLERGSRRYRLSAIPPRGLLALTFEPMMGGRQVRSA